MVEEVKIAGEVDVTAAVEAAMPRHLQAEVMSLFVPYDSRQEGFLTGALARLSMVSASFCTLAAGEGSALRFVGWNATARVAQLSTEVVVVVKVDV